MSGNAYITILGFCYLFIALGILLMLCYVIYKSVRGFLQVSKTIGGPDTGTLVIAMVVPLVIFADKVSLFVKYVLWLALEFFARIPGVLRKDWYLNLRECAKTRGEAELELTFNCVTEMGLGMLQSFTETVKRLYFESRIQDLPYEPAIYFVGLWLAVALLLREVPAGQGAAGSPVVVKSWITVIYDRLSSVSRKNILFFIILILAAYLSVAAIAAIPAFRGQDVQLETISQTLDKEMEEMLKKFQDELGSVSKDSGQVDPFQVLREIMKKLQSGTATPPSTSDAMLIAGLETTVRTQSGLRQILVTSWEPLLQSVNASDLPPFVTPEPTKLTPVLPGTGLDGFG